MNDPIKFSLKCKVQPNRVTDFLSASEKSIMPISLTSPSQSNKQHTVRTHTGVAAASPNTDATKGLAGSRTDSWEKFLVRDDLDFVHQRLRELQVDFPMRHLTSLAWSEDDDGSIKVMFRLKQDIPESRRGTLERIAFSQKVFVYVATIQERGMMGRERTILVKDLHIFGEKLVLADHMWLPLDRKWRAIEPVYQGTKVVLVGPMIDYERADGTTDYALKLSKVTRLLSNLGGGTKQNNPSHDS